MTPEDQQQLTTFLNTFDATGLGEGDINAGANTLAAMLCGVANIARPGSSIMSPGKKSTKVGTNLLVTGALSTSLITDDVLNKFRLRQNNITSHLERVRTTKEKEDLAERPKLIKFSGKNTVNQSEGSLRSMLTEEHGGMTSVVEKWGLVTSAPPNPGFDEITRDPKIVVTASRPSELEAQLQGTHLGHPLVLLGLNRASSTERMSRTCTALIDGHYPDGDGGKTVQGHMIITDPDNVLRELARNADENTAYLGRCIWLTDGDAGPEVPDYQPTVSPLGNIHDRFRSAVSQGFGKRLNHKSPYPVIHKLDITRAQIRWVKFLKGIEGTLPGISGHARTLLATLVFGALELTANSRTPVGTPNPLLGIEAFAQFLVLRMANAHSLMTYSARQARNDELKESILQKLEDGPHTVRDLTRRFSRLTSEPCRELLHDLEIQGKVDSDDGEWHLRPTSEANNSLTLDI